MGRGAAGEERAAQRRGALHEAEIVTRALEIIEADGVAGLTMRRLAETLGVSLGATYRHVPTKDDILRLVTLELYSRIGPCRAEDGDWYRAVRSFLVRFREVVCTYPGMAAYISAHLQISAPYQLYQSLRETLRDAGFSETGVDRVIRALFFYTSGAVLVPPALILGARARAEFIDGLDMVLDGARQALRIECPAGGQTAVDQAPVS